jgi:CBS domain-containing protein
MSLETYVKLVGCLSPRASVTEACQEMKSKGIGTVVVVSDDYAPIGLLTDRDVVMRVVAEGRIPDSTPLEEVMSGEVITLDEGASIRTATELMRDKGIRRIPITDENGRVTGIVALDDVLVLLGMEIGNLANAIFAGLSRMPEEEAAPPPQ